MKLKRLLCVLFMATMVLTVAQVEQAKANFVFSQKPKARFTVSQSIGYAPMVVHFINRSSYATEYKWTIVDDSRSTRLDDLDDATTNLIYIYDYPGVWPVYLEAENDVGSSMVMATVTVLPGTSTTVSVDFVGAPRAAVAGSEVSFINTTSGTWEKYLWDFGDGTAGTTEDPKHTYATAGLYTVSLTLFDGSNYYTKTKVNYINITPSSSSSISADFGAAPVTGTAPHIVQFSNLTAEDSQSVLWDFGDGATGSGLNPVHTYSSPGRYTVSLSVDGQVNTKAAYITTLSESLTQRSPAAVLLGSDLGQLAMLQMFRDGVLKETLIGLGVSELYQKHSLELVSILLANDALRTEATALLLELLPGFQAVVDGGTMTLTQAQLDKIRGLVGKIADQAGPELQAFLIQALSELANGQSFAGIGIVVTAN